jgi:hypothetical protein
MRLSVDLRANRILQVLRHGKKYGRRISLVGATLWDPPRTLQVFLMQN